LITLPSKNKSILLSLNSSLKIRRCKNEIHPTIDAYCQKEIERFIYNKKKISYKINEFVFTVYQISGNVRTNFPLNEVSSETQKASMGQTTQATTKSKDIIFGK
jgi:hypothetical protein